MSATNPAPNWQQSEQPQPGRSSPSKRILLVDDGVELRQLNAAALGNAGFEVTLAEDIATAWIALDAARYDLLITDHTLPKLTGIELLNELHVARKSLPAILVTEARHQLELHRYPWLHIAATLLKPHAAEDLFRTVRRVLGRMAEVGDPNPPRTLARA